MTMRWKAAAAGWFALAAMTLAGCGSGGSGGGGGSDAGGGTAEPQASVLVGTAAIGAALAGAQLTITDRNGAAVCEEASTTTGSAGEYRCTVKQGAAAPFIIVAVDPQGLVSPMVSLVAARPAAGQTANANVTPLTTAIVAQVSPNADPFALPGDAALLAALDLQEFDAVKRNVVAQLAGVLASVNVDATTFDPMATPFVGGSNQGADALLDQVRITFENGAPVMTNALNPDVSVPLADAQTAAPQPVPVAAVASFSVTELDFAKTRFEACFAEPAATRASSGACDGIVVDDAPAALTGGATYLNSGFNANQQFGPLVASAAMDGARFNRPELMRYFSQPDGRDVAVINLKFSRVTDNVADNRILVVKKFPGTEAGRGTAWWVYGNQQNLNIRVRAAIRQQEQMVPEASLAAFAGPTRYQTGLEIFIARPCSAPTTICPNSQGIQYVRVKGPGLPTNGLVYGDPALPEAAQSWMVIENATGVIPTTPSTRTNSNNIFYLQQSRGISGTTAFEIRPNPGVGSATPPDRGFAHPAMYGEAPDANWTFDLARTPAWSQYTFEVFRGGSTTTTETYSVRMVTPVVPAAYGAVSQWHAIPAQVRALASDGAPEAASLNLAWEINPYAQRIESVQAYSFLPPDTRVNSASTPVPPNASSRAVTGIGGSFSALNLSNSGQSRTLQWRYRMLDGSYKDQTVSFN